MATPPSTPLPAGNQGNHFGQLMDSIYSYQEAAAANLVNSIYDALTAEGTPRTNGKGSPVDTGALKANWKVGIAQGMTGTYIKRPKDGTTVPFVRKASKTYGTHREYFIWNNTPYLGYVNAGDTFKGKRTGPRENIKFIEQAIKVGEQNANAKLSAIGKTGASRQRRNIASSKILNMPFV